VRHRGRACRSRAHHAHRGRSRARRGRAHRPHDRRAHLRRARRSHDRCAHLRRAHRRSSHYGRAHRGLGCVLHCHDDRALAVRRPASGFATVRQLKRDVHATRLPLPAARLEQRYSGWYSARFAPVAVFVAHITVMQVAPWLFRARRRASPLAASAQARRCHHAPSSPACSPATVFLLVFLPLGIPAGIPQFGIP